MKNKKNQSRLVRYGFDAVLLATAVIVPFSVQAGVFQSFIDSEITTTETIVSQANDDSLLDVSVLAAAQNPDPFDASSGYDVIAQDGVLVSAGPVGKEEMIAKRSNGGEINVYTVREGDSLSQIASMFDVTANTILWANDLPRASAISPGDTLIILPIAGVRHVVKKGDTIAAVAKKYEGNAEEILSFNQLSSDTDLSIGDTLVIPGGSLHVEPVKVVAKETKKSKTTAKQTVASGASFSHPIPGALKTQGIHGYNAVDFGVGVGATVRAAASGDVIVSKSGGWNGGYGNYIVIKHKNGVQTLYAHLSRNDVAVGSSVSSGESIGASGNSGKSTGPHLHFEVRGGKNPF
jgi:LysM repeat protein